LPISRHFALDRFDEGKGTADQSKQAVSEELVLSKTGRQAAGKAPLD
jgi:hypothetical protein